MPWTRRQVRFLESSGSPLSSAQKDKMNRELHEDPALGHAKKGSSEMKKAGHKIREIRIEVHRDAKKGVTGHTVHTHHMPKATGKSGAFMEDTHESVPFDANGESKSHGHMLDHIAGHLGIQGAAEAEPDGDEGEGEGEEE